MRRVLYFVAALTIAGNARGQALDPNDVQAGHKLAISVCANCHVSASDQREEPILRPPAPSFVSIMQRKDITAEWLEEFIKTSHRTIDNPKGMPNPMLLDVQIKQVTSYLLSLRKGG